MHSTAIQVRPPAVAGAFYPAEAAELQRTVTSLLRDADGVGPFPKALIVPHAGYRYSGPVAASGYALLRPVCERIERVVLLGPAHFVAFHGLAASGTDEFATPLGAVPLDHKSVHNALRLPQVHLLDQAHRREHSLEVQLPFLQVVLGEFSLVPLAVGQSDADEVAGVLERLWGGDETLIVVSSDLSHYHEYGTARGIDSETAHLIQRCEAEQLTGERACGFCGIGGALKMARQLGLQVKTVDLRNSGDTAGAKDQVVGYGSFVIY